MHRHRAVALAQVAAARTTLRVAAKCRKRQHRHQAEQGAERAEELAEEPLDEQHAHRDAAEHDERACGNSLDVSTRNARERRPRAIAGNLRPGSREAQQADGHEHHVLQRLQAALQAGIEQRPFRLQLFTHGREQGEQNIPERAECAGVAAKETSQHHGGREHAAKQGQKRPHFHRLSGT